MSTYKYNYGYITKQLADLRIEIFNTLYNNYEESRGRKSLLIPKPDITYISAKEYPI
jgi:hypothetical protein